MNIELLVQYLVRLVSVVSRRRRSNWTTVIDVELSDGIEGLNTDTNVIINNVTDENYNGTYLVTEITSTNTNGVTGFKYEVPLVPGEPLPNPADQVLNFWILSPLRHHIFNVSLRSIYGMCGMHARWY